MMMCKENAQVDSLGLNWHWIKMETKDMWAEKRPPRYGRSIGDHWSVLFHIAEKAVSNCMGLCTAVVDLCLTFGSVAQDQLQAKLWEVSVDL